MHGAKITRLIEELYGMTKAALNTTLDPKIYSPADQARLDKQLAANNSTFKAQKADDASYDRGVEKAEQQSKAYAATGGLGSLIGMSPGHVPQQNAPLSYNLAGQLPPSAANAPTSGQMTTEQRMHANGTVNTAANPRGSMVMKAPSQTPGAAKPTGPMAATQANTLGVLEAPSAKATAANTHGVLAGAGKPVNSSAPSPGKPPVAPGAPAPALPAAAAPPATDPTRSARGLASDKRNEIYNNSEQKVKDDDAAMAQQRAYTATNPMPKGGLGPTGDGMGGGSTNPYMPVNGHQQGSSLDPGYGNKPAGAAPKPPTTAQSSYAALKTPGTTTTSTPPVAAPSITPAASTSKPI